jgi:hypothetical protein
MHLPSAEGPRRTLTFDRVLLALALVAMAGLALRVAWLLGAFDLMATIDLDGRLVTIANTFATVDHPFHSTRSDLLLESLRDGQILRWVGSHHGGYPVEFYPVGAVWLDVALWAALFGQFPIIAVHKLGVIVVFLLPGVAFWLLARGDRAHPFVPFLALAIHLAVPGYWWTGGYLELVEWGLVANVGGAVLALIALAALGRFVLDGGRWFAILAILASSGALFTNMRSGIAVGVSALAILLAVAIRRDPAHSAGVVVAVVRIAMVAGVAILLAAPLLVAMAQYSDLYFFVHFKEYIDFRDYWDSVVASVSWWFLAPALVGIPVALVVRNLSMMRMVAISVVIYAALTVALSQGGTDNSVIRQLETPRLMPFQRLLTVYLAAAAIGWLAQRVAGLVVRTQWRDTLVAAGIVAIAIVTVNAYPGTFAPLPVNDLTAPPEFHTTGGEEFAEFTDIVAAANDLRPDGTAILVVGDQNSWWHEQLWAPSVADGAYYYDDWMWYWHPDRPGPYNYDAGHFFPSPAGVFTSDWLAANGVSVLVVTNTTGNPDPRHAAAGSPLFEFRQSIGYWDVYTVRDIVPIVTNGDVEPVTSTFESGNITATFENAGGEIQVRHNWYPRWTAFADGEEVPVARTDAGTMTFTVPDGTREVELRYAVTGLDWLGRIAAIAGVALLVAIAAGQAERAMRSLYPESRPEPS